MYPTSSRATGAAWVLAVGRFGGVAGTFLGATLIGLGWPLTTIVAAVALPTVIASIAIFCIGFGIPSLRHRSDAVEAKAAFHG
jgi:AAHS family 4-hydroxybenzoate transporter-like MFS transporter